MVLALARLVPLLLRPVSLSLADELARRIHKRRSRQAGALVFTSSFAWLSFELSFPLGLLAGQLPPLHPPLLVLASCCERQSACSCSLSLSLSLFLSRFFQIFTLRDYKSLLTGKIAISTRLIEWKSSLRKMNERGT